MSIYRTLSFTSSLKRLQPVALSGQISGTTKVQINEEHALHNKALVAYLTDARKLGAGLSGTDK